MSNELQLIIKNEQIIPTQAEFLLENFKTIFETAKKIELKARQIVVSDKAKKIVENVLILIQKINNYIVDNANNL